MGNNNVLTIKAIFKGKHNAKQFHPVWKGYTEGFEYNLAVEGIYRKDLKANKHRFVVWDTDRNGYGTWGYTSFERFLQDWQVDKTQLTMLRLVF